MRTFFFRLVLCTGLVFPSLGVAAVSPVESPRPAEAAVSHCPKKIASAAPLSKQATEAQVPVSRTRQWIASLGLVCAVGAGGYVACRVLSTSHDIRIATMGAALAVGMGQLFTIVRKFFGPQADFMNQWTDRTGYAVNHSLVQWFRGMPVRLRALGDRVSPNLNVDIRGRLDEQQQLTAAKIGSINTHLDWLGLRLPELLEKGEVELAASQLVTTVVHVAYGNQEIILRTVSPHVDVMTRQLVLLAAQSYLFEKLAKIFNDQPGLLAGFNAAVQAEMDKQFKKAPMPFIAYRQGIEIVLNGWMAEAIRESCEQEFCVRIPE